VLRLLPIYIALLCAALSQTVQAADLTSLETRWLQGVWPVVVHAKQGLALPLDLVVQPQDTPGAAPLALGYEDSRCKLVFSLRGNPEGQRQINRLDPVLRAAALELMAAHELGHCRRYLDGAWYRLPAGFVAAQVPDNLSPELRQAWLAMRSTRREEGYGDLVGLAWTRDHHPELYTRLHAWLVAERSAALVPGSHHDTLDWLALARDPESLHGRTIFEAADRLWQRGLKD